MVTKTPDQHIPKRVVGFPSIAGLLESFSAGVGGEENTPVVATSPNRLLQVCVHICESGYEKATGVTAWVYVYWKGCLSVCS